MQQADFVNGMFLDAAAFNNAAAAQESSDRQALAAMNTPGLVNSSAITLTPSGNTVAVTFNATEMIFGDGTLAAPIGTTPGSSSDVYEVNFAPLIPASGSVTVYVVAQEVQIGQSSYQVIGPPPGHQDFNPAFVPFTAYAETVDSVSVGATTIVPDGETSIEIFRTVLTAGQGSMGTLDTAHQVHASSVLAPTGVAAGTYGPTVGIVVGADGRVTSLTNEGLNPTGVVAGTYSPTISLTVGSDGRVASIQNVGLNGTGVVAGTYAYPVSLQVGADGRLSSVTQGNVVSAGAVPGVTNPAHTVSIGWNESRLVAAVDSNLQGVLGPRVNMVTFATPGTSTWTVPAGVKSVKVRLVGGGGGSGAAGTESGGSGNTGSGSGGGAGGYAEGYVSVTPGQQITITVGAGGTAGSGSGTGTGGNGGTSSFGTLLTATGGQAGEGLTPFPAGGQGGTASADPSVSNPVLSPGGFGTDGAPQSQSYGGKGGASCYGGGGRAAIGGNGAPSQIGQAPGSGAGGAYGWSSGTNFEGAVGAAGIVIVEY